MTITYVEALPDADAFVPLLESTGWYHEGVPTVDRVTQTLRGSWCVVCAYAGDQLVGFGRVVSDGVLHAYINEMIVLPAFQSRGIGTAILNRLVSRCNGAGIRSIQLFSAQGKASFYERHGFVRRPDGAPGMEHRAD